jgi:hypothetical protein
MIRKFIASILILLGIASAIVSTYATVQPLSMAFTGSTKQIMVGMFIVVQLGVFFMAMTKHYIAKETPQHYVLINRISNILIIVSIVGTITFFQLNRHYVAEHTKSIEDLFSAVPFLSSLSWYDWLVNLTVNFIFTWSVCVLLDVMAVKLPLIGFDLTMKIKHKRVHETILTMSWAILTQPVRALVKSKYDKLSLTNNLTNEVKSGVKLKVKSVKSDGLNESKEIKRLNLTSETQDVPAGSEVGSEKELELSSEDELAKKRLWDKSIALTNEVLIRKNDSNFIGLVKKIEEYILTNYTDGETISTSDIRKNFNLTVNSWIKVKSNIRCIEAVGTKFKCKKVI